MPDGRPWPLVSIVTPSLNQAAYIEETIRSVLLQGYPNLEYVILDGGSTDGSVDVIRKYEKWLTCWTSEPDRGQADAINRGWRRTRGEVITWLNSDDFYEPDAVRTAVEFLVAHSDITLVYGGCHCVGPKGELLGTSKAWPFDLKRQITSRNLVLQSSSFFRRSALHLVGDLDVQLRYLMDYDLWLRMLRAGCTFQQIPRTLSSYRLHPGAKTVAERLPMSLELKVVIDRLFQANTPFSSRWRDRAYSSYYRSLGNVYYSSGQRGAARRELWRAIRFQPLRLTTVIVLAYLVDTGLGTRMGPALQRLRWRLPDAPEDDLLLGEGTTRQWL